MKKFGILTLGTVMIATGAVAAPPPAQEAPQSEKRVCRTEKVTGSLTRVRRTCMTQREWDELTQRTNREVGELVRQSGRMDSPSGGGPGGR